MNARFLPAAATLAAGLALAVPGAGAANSAAVVAIVTVPKPWYAPQFIVVRRMRETIPQYEQIPGLTFKMFSIAQADGQFGGIYLWRSRAEAEAWFSPTWFKRVRRERGVDGTVRFFDSLDLVDQPSGPPAATDDARTVATLVLASQPSGQSREQLVERFRMDARAKGAGRLRSHLVATADGRVGELTLWADAETARAALLPGTWGADATIEYFDVPILTPTRLAASRPQEAVAR